MNKKRLTVSSTVIVAVGQTAEEVVARFVEPLGQTLLESGLIQVVSLKGVAGSGKETGPKLKVERSVLKDFKGSAPAGKGEKTIPVSLSSFSMAADNLETELSSALKESRDFGVMMKARKDLDASNDVVDYDMPTETTDLKIMILVDVSNHDFIYAPDLCYLVRYVVKDLEINDKHVTLMIMSSKTLPDSKKVSAYSVLSRLNDLFNRGEYVSEGDHRFDLKNVPPADQVFYLDGDNNAAGFTLKKEDYDLLVSKALSFLCFQKRASGILLSTEKQVGVPDLDPITGEMPTKFLLSGFGLYSIEFPLKELIEIGCLNRTADFLGKEFFVPLNDEKGNNELFAEIQNAGKVRFDDILAATQTITEKAKYERVIDEALMTKPLSVIVSLSINDITNEIEAKEGKVFADCIQSSSDRAKAAIIKECVDLLRTNMMQTIDKKLNGLSRCDAILKMIKDFLLEDYERAKKVLGGSAQRVEPGLAAIEAQKSLLSQGGDNQSTQGAIISKVVLARGLRGGVVGALTSWLVSLMIPGINILSFIFGLMAFVYILDGFIIAVLMFAIKRRKAIGKLLMDYRTYFFSKHNQLRGEKVVELYEMLNSPDAFKAVEAFLETYAKKLKESGKAAQDLRKQKALDLNNTETDFSNVMSASEKEIDAFYQGYIAEKITGDQIMNSVGGITAAIENNKDLVDLCYEKIRPEFDILMSDEQFYIEKQIQRRMAKYNPNQLLELWERYSAPWWSITSKQGPISRVMLTKNIEKSIFLEAAGSRKQAGVNIELVDGKFPYSLQLFSYAGGVAFSSLKNVQDWAAFAKRKGENK